MKISPILFCITILCGLMIGGCLLNKPTQEEIRQSTKSLVDGNITFAISLYGRLKVPDMNLFFSPASLSTALSMTYEGAETNTEKEMAATLHLPKDPLMTRHACQTILNDMRGLQKEGDITILIANRLWPKNGYTFLDDYLKTVQTYYFSDIKTIDYGNPKLAASEINAWVDEKTKNQIQNLVQPDALTPNTRLLLTNAVYFKGNWENPFEPSRTVSGSFKTSSGDMVDVPMMNRTATCNYTENGKLKALEIPYAGKSISMVILLPKDEGDFKNLENTLSLQNLNTCFSKLEQKKVKMSIPRFRISSGFNLSQILTDLGMKDAFSKNADFSGMDGTKNLYLSAVLHKAFIDVNEKGTEAAAASAVIVAQKTAVEKLPIFRADHPFVFIIKENKHGSILFLGRVMNPLGK